MTYFFFGVAAVLALLGGLYWRWSRRVEAEVAEGADVEWAHLSEHDPELLGGLDREGFNAIYRRVTFPRFPGYAFAAVVAFAAALPLVFGVLAGGLMLAEQAGMTAQPYEIANRYLIDGDQMRLITEAPSEAALYYVRDLGGFYYFFGVTVVWLVIVAFFMRRYHARRPGYLRDEILRAR